MLMVTRRRGESLRLGVGIVITVAEIRNGKVRLALEVPEGLEVERLKAPQAPESAGEVPSSGAATPAS